MSFLPVFRAPLIGLISILALTACDVSSVEERGSAGAVTAQSNSASHATVTRLDVYKSETCGCCQHWIDHADERGFQSTIHHPADLGRVKEELGVDARYQSCHTAVTEDGYVFEGHIPAKLIHQFLEEKPEDAIGLAVPGMPLGSPGMEVGGGRFTPYQVLLLKKDGSAEVYAQVSDAASQY